MVTQEQLKQWEKEHEEADEIYRKQARISNEYAQNLVQAIEDGLPQIKFIIKSLSTNLKFWPLLKATTSLFPPITSLDLLGVSEGRNIDGDHVLVNLAMLVGSNTQTSSHTPYQVLEQDLNRFIIDMQSTLYRKILENADKSTKDYLNGKYFDNFSDVEKLEFFHHLALITYDFLAENGIEYKDIGDEKKLLQYPVFFSEENAKKFWVCFHYATLQNAIIEYLIEKYKIPIKVFSFHNYNIYDLSQGNHQNNIITDLEGNILALMDISCALKPSKPTTIEKLLEEDGEIYRIRDNEIIAGHYLIHSLASNDYGDIYYKLTPYSDWEPIEKLTIRFAKAQLQYYHQQIQPSPSVNPEATNPKVENHK